MHGQNWWPTSDGAPPLFATRRDPSRPTEGDQVGVIARALGTPLLPWQKYVADVATERRPDGSYEYQVVIVTVPRQTGKTTLLRALGVYFALVLGRDFFYTAQTGKDARARWYDLVKILRVNKALKDRVKIALRGGSEHVEFPGGHVFQCFAPTPESLHGYTPAKVCIDEAFAQTEGKGELLMGAIEPAQFTIVDKQIFIVSTMGTAESVWFHDWIARAMGGMDRVACFYWGATDEMNPFDLDDIARFHPAVGQQLGDKVITPADVLSAAEKLSRAEYERAYGNRKTPTGSNLIEAAAWRAMLADATPPADTSDLVLTYDVAADRRSAAIVASWIAEDGKPVAKIVRAEPGVDWLAPAVDALDTAWRPVAIAAAGHGPVLEVTEDLVERRGVHVDIIDERRYATASGAFLTLVDQAGLWWTAETEDEARLVTTSVTGLVTRAAVTDGVALSRRHSVGDSSPGICIALGVWLAQRHARDERPVVEFA